MRLRVFISFICTLILVNIANATVAVIAFPLLSGRVKSADIICAGIVVADNAVLPQAPDVAGAFRQVSIYPVYALKGDLPADIVTIKYGFNMGHENYIENSIYWGNEHTTPQFVVGAAYFFLLNHDGKSSFKYDEAIEGNAYVDDPAGGARQDIEQALQKNAGLPLPEGWRVQLDAKIAKAQVVLRSQLATQMALWQEKADGFVLISGIHDLTLSKFQAKVTPTTTPKNLGDTIGASATIRGFHAKDYVDMARQWNGIRSDGFTWDGTALGVAAGQLGVAGGDDVTVHTVEYTLHDTDGVVWVDGREGQAGLTTLKLAFSFSPDALKTVALPSFTPDMLYVVPFHINPGDDEHIALACGPPVVLPKDKTDRTWRSLRASASVINQGRYFVDVLKAKKPITDLELLKIEQLFGIKIAPGQVAPGQEGRSAAAKYWNTVVQYEMADRLARQIIE